MFNCRFFVAKGQPLSRGLHVHDDPGYTVDALRCQDNGWTVWIDGECHVEDMPFTSGDPGPKPATTILDTVSRYHHGT